MADFNQEKLILTNHFKIFKRQIEYLTKATTEFTSITQSSPFQPLNITAPQTTRLLPFVEYDEFETAILELINSSGSINSPSHGQMLATLLESRHIMATHKALTITILKKTKMSSVIHSFLTNGGMSTTLKWLQIGELAVGNIVDLGLTQHIMEWFCVQLEYFKDRKTIQQIRDVMRDILSLCECNRAVGGTQSYKLVAGFHHHANDSKPGCSSASLESNHPLRQTVTSLANQLVNYFVKNSLLPMQGSNTLSSASSVPGGKGSSSTREHKGTDAKVLKRPLKSPESSHTSTTESRSVVDSSLKSDKVMSKLLGEDKTDKVAKSSTPSSVAPKVEVVTSTIHPPPPSGLVSLNERQPANKMSGKQLAQMSKSGADSTLPSRPNAPTSHDGIDDKLNAQRQTSQSTQYLDFKTFMESKPEENLEPITYNSTTKSIRKIRWADELEGGSISQIKEFEVLAPLYDTGDSAESIESKAMENGLVDMHSSGSEGDHRFSVADLSKREREVEKMLLKKSHDEAHLELMRAGATMKPAHTDYVTPRKLTINGSEVDEHEKLSAIDSKEKKLQTQRISKKLEVIHMSDKDIPEDCEPPAMPTNAVIERGISHLISIPWGEDKIETEYVIPHRTSSNNSSTNSDYLDEYSNSMEVDDDNQGRRDDHSKADSSGSEEEDEEEDENNESSGMADLFPEFVKCLTESQLEKLVELLQAEENQYLLLDLSQPDFIKLVESFAPGTYASYERQKQQTLYGQSKPHQSQYSYGAPSTYGRQETSIQNTYPSNPQSRGHYQSSKGGGSTYQMMTNRDYRDNSTYKMKQDPQHHHKNPKKRDYSNVDLDNSGHYGPRR